MRPRPRKLPGVIAVVRDGSFLGVVAEREEQAIKAREALIKSAQWKLGPQLPDPATLFAHLKTLPSKDEVIGVKQAPALASAPRTFEATYTKPYMAHASIGPSAALAELRDGRMTVWTHSQGVFPLRAELVKALKMPPASIRCIHVEGSGCYGHNGADDVALDAALLARGTPGRPVRLQWMRDDEFAWEPYGPAMVMQAKASLNADGQIADWQYELWSNTHSTRPTSTSGTNVLAAWYLAEPQKMGPHTSPPQPAGGGDRNSIPLYEFPNQRVVHHFLQEMPIRGSALRTLGAYANVFASESFMDELAAAAECRPGRVPARAHEGPARPRGDREGRGHGELAAGRERRRLTGRGIGFSKYKNLACYVAWWRTSRSIARAASVRVPRAWAATDAGLVINPDGLNAQIEGGIVQSASWTLYEEVTLQQGRHSLARLGELSDRDHARRAEGRGRADQPADRTVARRRRRLAGPGGGGDRQCLRQRHRQTPSRPAVHARPGEEGAWLDHTSHCGAALTLGRGFRFSGAAIRPTGRGSHAVLA